MLDRSDKFWVRGDRGSRVRTGEEGTGHEHAEHGLADVLRGPGVVAGRGGAAHDAPDERHPGHGLGELQADLPDVVGALAAADAEELLDAGALVILLLVRHCADGEVSGAGAGAGRDSETERAHHGRARRESGGGAEAGDGADGARAANGGAGPGGGRLDGDGGERHGGHGVDETRRVAQEGADRVCFCCFWAVVAVAGRISRS